MIVLEVLEDPVVLLIVRQKAGRSQLVRVGAVDAVQRNVERFDLKPDEITGIEILGRCRLAWMKTNDESAHNIPSVSLSVGARYEPQRLPEVWFHEVLGFLRHPYGIFSEKGSDRLILLIRLTP